MKRYIFISLLSFGLVSLFQMPMGTAEDLQVSDTGQTSGLQGSTRINWGTGNNAATPTNGSASSQVVSAPGAPELPASMMFGGGFLVLGFGLMFTRRLW